MKLSVHFLYLCLLVRGIDFGQGDDCLVPALCKNNITPSWIKLNIGTQTARDERINALESKNFLSYTSLGGGNQKLDGRGGAIEFGGYTKCIHNDQQCKQSNRRNRW
ncbi:uncharacterized protein LOC144427269 [Styela clava]